MRRTTSLLATSLVAVMVTAGPALAEGAASPARPWHYWIAPFLLVGAVVLLAAIGIGYYVRVVGGRSRR